MIAAHELQNVDKVEKALLLALAIFTNEKSGQCNPSLETLTLRTGYGRSTLSAAITRLKDRQLLIVRRSRTSMDFELTLAPKITSSETSSGEISRRRTDKIQEADCQDPGAGPKVVTEIRSEIEEAPASVRRSAVQQIRAVDYEPPPEVCAEILAERPELRGRWPQMLENFRGYYGVRRLAAAALDHRFRTWADKERVPTGDRSRGSIPWTESQNPAVVAERLRRQAAAATRATGSDQSTEDQKS